MTKRVCRTLKVAERALRKGMPFNSLAAEWTPRLELKKRPMAIYPFFLDEREFEGSLQAVGRFFFQPPAALKRGKLTNGQKIHEICTKRKTQSLKQRGHWKMKGTDPHGVGPKVGDR